MVAIQLLRKGLAHIGADTSTVNLVIGLILIAVLFLDRQLNVKGKEEFEAMTEVIDRATPAPSCDWKGSSKPFPASALLTAYPLSILPGEVHALMGENGAGKSTLMKVLGGIHQPDEGQIIVDEKPVVMSGPLGRQGQGIVFIHQELSLADELSVAENIYLGELPRKRFGLV